MSNAAASKQRRQRLSYTLEGQGSHDTPLLSLPPRGVARFLDPRPLIIASHGRSHKGRPSEAQHPRHCLGVSALALDLSTVVVSQQASATRSDTPRGILYSAGRDGLLAAWELDLPTKKRRRTRGSRTSEMRSRRARLASLGLYSDSGSDNEEDLSSSDSDSESDYVDLGSNSGSNSSASASQQPSTPRIPYDERWQVDHQALARQKPKTSFRQSVKPHTDWINDVVLCNLNQTVISASSDQTVRAWNPHDPTASMQPALLGTHDDYVKTLAHSKHAHWIASGGFDRHIKLWDIGETRSSPLLDIEGTSDVSSIYTLASTPSGHLLASGTPEKIIRLWDPRQAQPQIARLRGHADNIRSVLLSRDGKLVLSASSDSTIKLWSTSMQRCIHTFTHHHDSVWSLFSAHPNLDLFYSGDRSGYVCKVDLENTGDLSEGECVVLCKDDDTLNLEDALDSDSDTDTIAEEGFYNKQRFGRSEGINAIMAADDTFVWTATGSSTIQKWKDVAPRSSRKSPMPAKGAQNGSLQGLAISQSYLSRPTLGKGESGIINHSLTRTMSQLSNGSTSSLGHASSSPSGTDLRGTGTATDLRRGVSFHSSPTLQQGGPTYNHHRKASSVAPSLKLVHESPQPSSWNDDVLNGIPFESLVCMDPDIYVDAISASQSLLAMRPLLAESQSSLPSTRYNAASPVSPPLPQMQPQMQEEPGTPFVEYLHREVASDAVPLRTLPEEVVWGRRGLVRCELLNDRRTVLTADTAGDIAAWDIVLCKCLGTFDRAQLAVAQATRQSSAMSMTSSTASQSAESTSGLQQQQSSGAQIKELLELVRSRIEGEGVTQSWASVDVRTGSLAIHLDENSWHAGEAYTDELDLHFTSTPDAARVNLGKLVVRNLLNGFLQNEMQKVATYSQLHPHITSLGSPTSPRLTRSVPLPQLTLPPQTLSMDGNVPLPWERRKSSTAGIALATPAATRALPPSDSDVTDHRASATATLGRSGTTYSDASSRPASSPTSLASDPASGGDYFSTGLNSNSNSNNNLTSSVPSMPVKTPSGSTTRFMDRLKTFGKTKRPTSSESNGDDTPTGPMATPRALPDSGTPAAPRFPWTAEETQAQLVQSKLQLSFSPPPLTEVPLLRGFPQNLVFAFASQTSHSAAWSVSYISRVGLAQEEAAAIEQFAPVWLLEYLLWNKAPIYEPQKLTFTLHPWVGDGYTALSELPTGHSRLTANRLLRMSKVSTFVLEKLDTASSSPQLSSPSHGEQLPRTTSQTSLTSHLSFQSNKHSASKPCPEESIEILCNDVVLPPRATLASIRQYCFKKSGDLPLYYRAAAPSSAKA